MIGPRGKFIINVSGETQNIKGLGVLDTGRLIDLAFGGKVELVDENYIILSPSLFDKLETIKRKAQIILPKDSLQIIGLCDIRSGSRVIEGGAGSGALTIVLSHFVAPDGMVFTYDNRDDFLKVTRSNLISTGTEKNVELKSGDVTEGFSESEIDAVILDIPNPWDAVEHARSALKAGGYFAAYVPTTNQVEKVVKKLKEIKFMELRTHETIQREIVSGPGGVRPSFDMLGHTGYITVARKII